MIQIQIFMAPTKFFQKNQTADHEFKRGQTMLPVAIFYIHDMYLCTFLHYNKYD